MILGIGLALGSALTHAAWNGLAKRFATDGVAALWAYTAVSFLLLAPVCLVAVLRSPGAVRPGLIGAAAVSGVLHGGYGAMVQLSYRRYALSEIYPVSRGLAPVLIAVVGLVTLGQQLDVVQWTGVVVLGAALAIVGLGGVRHDAPAVAGDRDGAAGSALLWGGCIGLAITAYSVWDAWAVVDLHAQPLVYFCIGGALQLTWLTVLCRRRLGRARSLVRQMPGAVLTMAVLIPTSYLLALFATRLAPVGVVSAVRGTSVLWAALMALVVLRERPTRPRMLLLGAATVAIALLAR